MNTDVSISTPLDHAPLAAMIGTHIQAELPSRTAMTRPQVKPACDEAAAGAAVIEHAYSLVRRSEGHEAATLAPTRERLAAAAANHALNLVERSKNGTVEARDSWRQWAARQFNRPAEFAETLRREEVLAWSPKEMARLLVDATRVEMRLRELGNPAVVKDMLANARSDQERASIMAKVSAAEAKADELGAALDGIPPEVARVLIGVRSSLYQAKEVSKVLPEGPAGAHARQQLGEAFAVIEARYTESISKLAELFDEQQVPALPGAVVKNTGTIQP